MALEKVNKGSELAVGLFGNFLKVQVADKFSEETAKQISDAVTEMMDECMESLKLMNYPDTRIEIILHNACEFKEHDFFGKTESECNNMITVGYKYAVKK